MSRTVANVNPAADPNRESQSAGVDYERYKRTHDSSTISPRSSMMGSKRKVKGGEGRSEDQRSVATAQTYSCTSSCLLSSIGMYRTRYPLSRNQRGELTPGAKPVRVSNRVPMKEHGANPNRRKNYLGSGGNRSIPERWHPPGLRTSQKSTRRCVGNKLNWDANTRPSLGANSWCHWLEVCIR